MSEVGSFGLSSFVARLFTVPCFSVRLSRSSAHRHKQPVCSWLQMYRRAGFGAYGGTNFF